MLLERRPVRHAIRSTIAVVIVVLAAITATAGEPVPETPWAETYDGPAHGDDEGWRVVTSSDGSTVYTAGWSQGEHGRDYVVLAYASDGTPAWSFRYDGSGNGRDQALGLAVAPDGTTVYVTGLSVGAETNWDVVTIAIDATTGEAVWTKRFDGASHDRDVGNDVIVSPDGNRVFVTGCTATPHDGCVGLTIAYVGGTGQRVWTSRSDGPGDGIDSMYDATLSANGAKVLVTGTSDNRRGWAMVIVAYKAADGAEIWATRYRGGLPGGFASGNALVATHGGTIHAVGDVHTGAKAGTDYATLALDAGDGQVLWAKRYNGPGSAEDIGWDIEGDATTGAVFVTGGSGGDIATVAYDAATGDRRWARRDAGSDEAFGFAVVLTPDGGSVVATGRWGAVATECHTSAYDPESGALEWNEVYGGGSFDACMDAAAGTVGGRIYLTGTTRNVDLDLDVLTLGYDVVPEAPGSVDGTMTWEDTGTIGAAFRPPGRLSPMLGSPPDQPTTRTKW